MNSQFEAGVLTIETPEAVRFALPLAGPVTRFLAWAIDLCVILTAVGVLGRIARLVGAVSTDAMLAITTIAYFAVWIGYGICFEWIWHGQTPGKRVLGLRVMELSGARLEFSQIAIRNLIRVLDSLPGLYLVGGVVLLANRRFQRVGDLMANTVVARVRRLEFPDLLRTTDGGDKYNSFLEVPHLAARLRQSATPELVHLACQAILRREQLAPDTRVLLFRKLADQFRSQVKFPNELTLSLSDERYVRNAVQVATSRTLNRRHGNTAK